MSKNTFSFWLQSVINNEVYKSSPDPSWAAVRARTHEVRRIAASLQCNRNFVVH